MIWSILVQTNLVYSSQIQSNLVKFCQIQKNHFQIISGSIQRMWRLFIVQSSLDQTSEDKFSILQSKLVKSSQIQSNLDKSFLGYFWRYFWLHQTFLFLAALSGIVQSGLDQCTPIESTLVKSCQMLSNLEKSILGYFWQHILVLYSQVWSNLVFFIKIQSKLLESSLIQTYLY